MKGLAVSNIAWPASEDDAVAKALVSLGVQAIEIAPTKLFPNPAEVTDDQIDECRARWNDRGLEIVAAQALLFGHPELTIFDDAAIRGRTRQYLKRIIHVCARLGAKALVFGSPKNRLAKGRDVSPEAIEFFGQLGSDAAQEGTAIVMEANPPDYGADFVTRAMDAVELVKAVDHPGFRLHLDTACMTLAGDSIKDVFDVGFRFVRHFHVSEPQLAPIGADKVDHAAFARELKARNYEHWVSIEMREIQPFDLDGLKRAVTTVQKVYLASGVA
ncbi:MAG: sugar phosphate isomerase/epimerase family protein [Gemmataceae bacterium]